eukprot:TRINITY_DN35637_c0_g1_i1.p1 TRINITY_DN35637_c0_g1~~TRINITY_DN35637_c0_g1_i1.p1  ORF type:complete len:529 (-),score=48.59 TRINITY_DN35637_c0_g1_i1:70-1656(-)
MLSLWVVTFLCAVHSVTDRSIAASTSVAESQVLDDGDECSLTDDQCTLYALQRKAKGIEVSLQNARSPRGASTRSDDIATKFNSIGSAGSPGGILVRFYMSDKLTEKVWTADGAGQGGPLGDIGFSRASAWSYWRRDLAPMKIGVANVGIIVDPDSMWKDIDLLYVTDSSSNIRKGCSMYYGRDATLHDHVEVPASDIPRLLRFPCVQKAANDAGFSSGDALYWDTSFPAAADTECAADDHRCQAVSAGGCLPWHFWTKYGPWCHDASNPLFADFAACFNFTRVQNGSFRFSMSGSCIACQHPYMCNLAEAASGTNASNHIFFNVTAQEFQANVGTDGSQWMKVFLPSATKEAVGLCEILPLLPWICTLPAFHVLGPAPFPISQCAFRGRDTNAWSAWVRAQHSLYEKVLYAIDAGETPVRVYHNELDMYVQPNTDDRFQLQMQKLFQSIIGVVVNVGGSMENRSLANATRDLQGAVWLQNFLSLHKGETLPLCEISMAEVSNSGKHYERMRAALDMGVELGSFMTCK